MDLLESLKKRRSYKFPFEKKQIDPKIIEKCINISKWAPSAHNSQPWRYIVLQNMDLRTKLINRMNNKLRKDLRNDGKSEEFIENKIKTTKTQFLQAPILIVACMDLKALKDYQDSERKHNEFVLGVLSVASSITYLLISLQEHSLVSCWYSAPLFAREIVSEMLKLPGTYYPLAFITVGYPSIKEITPPKHQKLDTFFFYNSNLPIT